MKATWASTYVHVAETAVTPNVVAVEGDDARVVLVFPGGPEVYVNVSLSVAHAEALQDALVEALVKFPAVTP